MTALDGAPVIEIDSAALENCPSYGTVPYVAKTPALMKSQINIKMDPNKRTGRRPNLSTQINPGIVMTTLMMN